MSNVLHADMENEARPQIEKEFEDFAYIVSHDLNAPLRHIREFTRLLIGGRKENLTPEEQEYVTFLEKSLERMDGMQSALLSYSRLNTRAEPFRETNLNDTVAGVLKDLDQVIKEHPAVVECGPLPTLTVEPKQIALLFFHLIDNALKFHEDTAKQRKVLITAQEQGDTWLFEVKDNGIGIDQNNHKRIFRLFHRLHDTEQYSGTGAGLTIAHKIVQRHGGSIRVESGTDQGTSVFFSLPK